MKQWQPLRILIVGQQDQSGRILATNIQGWGYTVVRLPDMLAVYKGEAKTFESDVLLYDLDESFRTCAMSESSSVLYHDVPIVDFLRSEEAQWLRNRLTIVFSSHSVSRTMLEQIGAIALLYKPFHLGRLQRYLRVLQHLVYAEKQEKTDLQASSGMVRVLIVDDDEDITHAVARCLLYEPGYVVAVAHDGLDALEKCIDWRPHCIVTDLIMPWMNGYQIIRCLTQSTLRSLPSFVIMSALTQREVQLSPFYKGRAVVYVDKPFSIDHLLDVIRQVCA